MASILIVEDEALPADVLLLIARRCGHDATVVQSGQEAVARLKTAVPDLIILDIGLRDMDGFEVLAYIRAQPELAKVRVAIYSANGSSKSMDRARRAGASDYWLKSSVGVAEITKRFQELPRSHAA